MSTGTLCYSCRVKGFKRLIVRLVQLDMRPSLPDNLNSFLNGKSLNLGECFGEEEMTDGTVGHPPP